MICKLQIYPEINGGEKKKIHCEISLQANRDVCLTSFTVTIIE